MQVKNMFYTLIYIIACYYGLSHFRGFIRVLKKTWFGKEIWSQH